MEESMSATTADGMPEPQGLYDPAHEHDACGVGFVVDIKGRKSHAIVSQALQVLKNLQHRGACGCEVNTGDGAGILIQMPHAFLARECGALGIALPAPGQYGVGLVFLPRDAAQAARCRALFETHRRARKARRSSAGARCRPTTRRSGRARARPSR